MNYSKKLITYLIIYIVLSAISIIGLTMLLDYSWRLNFLIAFLHFLGFVSIGIIGLFRANAMGLAYLCFLIVKVGAFLVLFYSFPQIKSYLILSVALYLYYLFLETGLLIGLIQTQFKKPTKIIKK